MRKQLIESMNPGKWFVDLWSDGTMEVFSTYKNRVNVMHKLYPNSSLQNSTLPQYVLDTIYVMRDRNRKLLRLYLAYRISSYHSKHCVWIDKARAIGSMNTVYNYQTTVLTYHKGIRL